MIILNLWILNLVTVWLCLAVTIRPSEVAFFILSVWGNIWYPSSAVKSSGMQNVGSQTLICLFFFLNLLGNLLYIKKAFCYFFSKVNFLSLTCYKMSHVKKPSVCEVYPFSVKTLQTKQLACSLFKMLLLKAELSSETSYVWSIIQCVWDNNTL